MTSIYTIGHSTRTSDELFALLARHDIRRLVDVRSYPGSRHVPQHGSQALRERSEVAGVVYESMLDLGGRRNRQEGADDRNAAWRNASFRNYADYAQSDRFSVALTKLEQEAELSNVAYMCAEAVPWRCHRTIISDALTLRGWDVEHIMDNGLKRHILGAWGPRPQSTGFGTPFYPSGQMALFS
jgi:uncharacterized protein (DUF488 family)